MAFLNWAAEPVEPDDPSDVYPPDRPEYPDGPDPEYRAAAASTGPRRALVTPVGDTGGEPRRDGIAQHLGDLAHLSGNPRMRAWRRRIIIGIVVGVAFGVWLNWRYGLTFALVAMIADTVYRSRTVFDGPADVRLTVAQRRTLRQLAQLERKGYRAIHCSLIPGSDEQIDHLVIGPTGVFAIDSEAWDRRMPVRTRQGRQLWHGPRSMKDRLEHARWESERAAELLSNALGSPVSVRAAMAVYGPQIPWEIATIRDVDVFSGPRLRKYLRRRAKAGTRMLSASETERIYKAAHIAFPHGDAD